MSAQAQFKNIVAKVLYDFNAEEPGELSIKAGNTLTILERCNESWWKGQIDGNVGLFPANFVSFDMSIPIPTKIGKKCKVDDALMTECLQRLLSANPVYPQDDEFEIISLEKTCKKMKIEVINKIEELKLKESKYLESDRLYNDTIISYKQLIDDSRKQPMIGYNQPMNTQSNAPMYTNQEQYPQQSYSMADYPQNMPFNPLYSNQQYQYPPTQPNLLPNMSLPPNTSPSYYNKDYTYHQ
ncbi:hypothetical protein HZS_3914 [Henneguya salminicola]|nr:hypothetical protein HZS_3914 [Henneguya salminicola]